MNNIINFLDFRNAKNQSEYENACKWLDLDRIRNELLDRIEDVLCYLLPKGKIKDNKFLIGSIKGEKGKSMSIALDGPQKGKWFDFATKQGGDILTLWREVLGYQQSEFGDLLCKINDWLGHPTITINDICNQEPPKKSPPMDNLGKPTAKYDYFDKNNKLIAVVNRYDPQTGKEFRVWDVQSRKAKSPDIRPLYNIPGIINSKKIIIVEGEKSADALIEKGFTATTAMCGANAPLEKTDWSPLKDKEVIIWPDNDVAGINYAKKLSEHLQNTALFISVLTPPQDKKDKWDVYDAIKEKFDVTNFLNTAKSIDLKLPSYSISEFLNDNSPMPWPRSLTHGVAETG